MRVYTVFETQQQVRVIVALTEGEVKQLADPEAEPVHQMVLLGERPHRMEIVCDDEAAFNPDIPSPSAKVISGKRRKGKVFKH